MAKSKYFGYTLRNAGTPYQQWVLNELPISITGIYTGTINTAVTSLDEIPVNSVVINQIGGRINADGSITLPQGIYKIDYSMTVTTSSAGTVSIALKDGATIISQTTGYTTGAVGSTPTTSLIGTGVVKLCSCNNTVSLVNTSESSITPILSGTETVRIIITRIV